MTGHNWMIRRLSDVAATGTDTAETRRLGEWDRPRSVSVEHHSLPPFSMAEFATRPGELVWLFVAEGFGLIELGEARHEVWHDHWLGIGEPGKYAVSTKTEPLRWLSWSVVPK